MYLYLIILYIIIFVPNNEISNINFEDGNMDVSNKSNIEIGNPQNMCFEL